jgi:hypothetical protein
MVVDLDLIVQVVFDVSDKELVARMYQLLVEGIVH